MKIQKKGFTLIELMIVIAIIAIIAAIAIPNLIEARKSGNESSAIGSLKAITTAQTMFSQSDKDGNGFQNYASDLTTLSAQSCGSLIDGTLGGGTKTGYLFACDTDVATQPNAAALWAATAAPITPGTTGDRYFWVNQAGQIFYTGQQGMAPPAADEAATQAAGAPGYIVLGK